MKKSLRIKNSEGIYVARASFSSDETIIDFVKNNNNLVDCSSSSNVANSIALPIEPNFESQSIQLLPSSPGRRAKRRNPVNKVLKILHLKRKSSSKMDEQVGDDAVESTSSASKSPTFKGRTATLVKKISIVKKTDDGAKKSAIPMKSSASVETISQSLTASSPTTLSTTTATLSVSEMNLVNIDYRQEESSSGRSRSGGRGSNLNIDLHVDRRTQFQDIRSKFDCSGSGNKSTVIDRTYRSNSRIPTGRTGKTNQLQITISGTKRSSNVKIEEPQLMHRLESLESRRPTKSSSSRGCIAFNAIGVLPAPTTQAPSMPYRISSGKIENVVVHNSDDSHTKSVMSAPAAAPVAAGATPIESIDRSAKQKSSKLLTSATATSLDCDDLEKIAHPLTPDERRNSLLTELIEAENREPMSKLPERGRRYPGMAASETIKFQLQTKTNTESDEEMAKALTSVSIPTVRVDSPAGAKPKENDDDVATSNVVTDDNCEKEQTPAIQFEVGKEVRPIITSQRTLHQNISTAYDNNPTATTIGSTQDYEHSINSPKSLIGNSACLTVSLSPLPPPPPIADDSLNKDYAKQDHRRRIAYTAQTTQNINNNSASASHSIEDEELAATTTAPNTAEYSDQFRFDSRLTQFCETPITDYYMMPAYGDLVWSDDGVNRKLHTKRNFSILSGSAKLNFKLIETK